MKGGGLGLTTWNVGFGVGVIWTKNGVDFELVLGDCRDILGSHLHCDKMDRGCDLGG